MEKSEEKQVMLMLAITLRLGRSVGEKGDHTDSTLNKYIKSADEAEFNMLTAQSEANTSIASGQRVLKAFRDAFLIS